MTSPLVATRTLTLWAGRDLELHLGWTGSTPVSATLRRRGEHGANAQTSEGHAAPEPRTQPLVELLVVGHGRRSANLRNTATTVGARLRYRSHDERTEGGWRIVEVEQLDEVTGLTTISTLRSVESAGILESWTTVRNEGTEVHQLHAVSSLMLARPVGDTPISRTDSIEGTSEWLGECRWDTRPVRDQAGLPRLDLAAHQRQDSRGAIAIASQGAWSSGRRVPAGVLATRGGGPALAWQVRHNGAWRVELDERLGDADAGFLVLGMFGPTDADHAWSVALAPGAAFTTIPVGIAVSEHGWSGALAGMTALRRRLAPPGKRPSVIFNDYMNTLMGDPTTAKLLPLIDAAATTGAEIFAVDAGWYDDGGDWWDSVGLWEPSTTRFPNGLSEVLSRIVERGMVPGLWLEPEVIGVNSPVADRLPDEAFMQRGGVRIVEHDRYLLDLRHPAARAHLDGVVDRLVDDLGVGFFKLDYNVTPGTGTDLDADSPGDGLLQHNRALLDWIDGVVARHPHLVIENCASGGMRADYAMLSRLHVQSTSDQQNPLLYPPVAAGSLVSILPEQAGNWAYPQPSMTPEEIVFTMCTGLAGRMILSCKVDQMDTDQLSLVREGVELARRFEGHLTSAVPTWPLGLVQWEQPWVAVGLSTPEESYVVIWSRGDGRDGVELDIPDGDVEVLYPSGDAFTSWEVNRPSPDRLAVSTTSPQPQARVLRIVHQA